MKTLINFFKSESAIWALLPIIVLIAPSILFFLNIKNNLSIDIIITNICLSIMLCGLGITLLILIIYDYFND